MVLRKILILSAILCAISYVSCNAAGSDVNGDWAKARLESSPRHGEWVNIPGGDQPLRAFVVYPEVAAKVPVVIVIHEIFGMTDWVRGLCDQLAEAGYIAIAPDFLTGSTYHGVDEARNAISKLSPKQIITDLDLTAAYALKLPAVNGRLAVAGFCWGGGQAFLYAAENPKLNAAYIFYGPPPETPIMAKISCPVFGFYGGNDARITATVPDTKKAMAAAGKKYKAVIYDEAGHGFMRAGEAPDADSANRKAREEAWKLFKSLLAKM